MLHCINNSGILRASLELLSNDDYDTNNEFITMCTRFGLNGNQMISLVTTLDISLLDNHYETIWDGLNYYSMACMDDYKTAYIESLYKTDLMDARIELLCDDLKEYIKCNSCINVENKCRTFKDACKIHHDVCVKYLLNNPQKHDVENDIYEYDDDVKENDYYFDADEDCDDDISYENTEFIDYMCICGGSLEVIKYAFEIQKNIYAPEIRKDVCGEYTINWASQNGNLDVVKYLFEIQKKDCTTWAIEWASWGGHLDVVKYLFEIQKKDCSSKAIDNASWKGHLDVVKYLFEIQNKDCTDYAIDRASMNGHLDVIKYLFEIQKKDCTDDAIKYAKNDTIRDYVKKMKKKL